MIQIKFVIVDSHLLTTFKGFIVKAPFRMLPLALIVIAVSGCSTMDNPKSSFSSGPLKVEDYIKPSFAKKADPSNSQLLLQSGTEYLQQGDLQKAHSVFSVALKVDIRKPR